MKTTSYRIRYPGGHVKLDAITYEEALRKFRTHWTRGLNYIGPRQISLDKITTVTMATDTIEPTGQDNPLSGVVANPVANGGK